MLFAQVFALRASLRTNKHKSNNRKRDAQTSLRGMVGTARTATLW